MAGIAELAFAGLEVADENVLMGVADGLKVTQIRLGPARLTHCMRWLGLAKRCMEIAQGYVSERTAFGTRLADRESVQIKLGRAASAIEIGRLLVMKAAWRLDQGERASTEISMAKVQVADTLHLAADTAIQLNARGAIPRTRCWSGSTATPARPGWSTAPARSMRWSSHVPAPSKGWISGDDGCSQPAVHTPGGGLADRRSARAAKAHALPGPGAGEPWAYGTDLAYLQELTAYWAEGFDWRAQEARLNALPQFKVPLHGIDLHYLHVQELGRTRRRCCSCTAGRARCSSSSI